jgi:hypothetical protein
LKNKLTNIKDEKFLEIQNKIMQNNNNNPFAISDYQQYLNFLNSSQNNQNTNQTVIIEKQPEYTKQSLYTNLENQNNDEMSSNIQENFNENVNIQPVLEQKKGMTIKRKVFLVISIILWFCSITSLLTSIISFFVFTGEGYISAKVGYISLAISHLVLLAHFLKTFLVQTKRIYSIVSTILSFLFTLISIIAFILLNVYNDGWSLLFVLIYFFLANLVILILLHIFLIFQDTYLLIKEDF